jgi:hypothetical protein
MNSCIEQTVDGINQQIRRIKEVAEKFSEQELITSLTLFNDHITPVWDQIRWEGLQELTFSDYRPDGSTALLDAIGLTVNEMQQITEPELLSNEASCVVVIITDGYENSSKKYSHEQISTIIKELELTGKWTFSYIGATLDAIDIAESFNIKNCNAMRIDTNNMSYMFNRLDDALNDYLNDKQNGKISEDFLDNET